MVSIIKKRVKKYKTIGVHATILALVWAGTLLYYNANPSPETVEVKEVDKPTETISTNEKSAIQEKVKNETPEQIAESEEKAKAKAEAEAKKDAENLVALVHLDDVKDLPKYTIETYRDGDEMPAANGYTMNCTYPSCYKVTFDVNGSGQNPTGEYNSLRTKLQDRSILDNSYDGPELATKNVEYWTKDGSITVRFYK